MVQYLFLVFGFQDFKRVWEEYNIWQLIVIPWKVTKWFKEFLISYYQDKFIYKSGCGTCTAINFKNSSNEEKITRVFSQLNAWVIAITATLLRNICTMSDLNNQDTRAYKQNWK